MGCWNKTCGISQFPIFAGQKTVSFVIIENERYGNRTETSPCYNNPYWDFVPLPIYGEYNDYGGQEDDEGQEYKYQFLREYFKNRIVKVKDESFFKVENPFTDSESLASSVNRGTFGIESSNFGKRDGHPHRAISVIMFNRDLFEKLTESATLGSYRWDKTEARTFTKADLCKVIEAYQNYEANHDKNDDLTMIRGRTHIGMLFNAQNYDSNDYYNLNPSVIEYFTRDTTTRSHTQFFDEFSQRLKPLDVVDSFMLICVMNQLRLQVIPQSHEGSQSDIEDIHQKYVNALQSIIDARNEYFGEDEDEDENETD